MRSRWYRAIARGSSLFLALRKLLRRRWSGTGRSLEHIMCAMPGYGPGTADDYAAARGDRKMIFVLHSASPEWQVILFIPLAEAGAGSSAMEHVRFAGSRKGTSGFLHRRAPSISPSYVARGTWGFQGFGRLYFDITTTNKQWYPGG